MKSSLKAVDTVQISGFTISIIISVGLILARQNTIASVTLGLVLAVLIQLFDLQMRHSASEERLLQAGALAKTLYKNDWLLSQVRQIVNDYDSVTNDWFEVFKLRANDNIADCRNALHSMAEGYAFAKPRSPNDFGVEGFHQAQGSVRGVDAGDISYWNTAYGEKYFEANVAAIKRGVTISRVFVQPRDRLHESVEVFKKQRDAGIQVYIAFTDEVPREYNRDYMIVDDKVMVDVELAGDRQGVSRRISIVPEEIEQRKRQFNLLLKYAKSLDVYLSDSLADRTSTGDGGLNMTGESE